MTRSTTTVPFASRQSAARSLWYLNTELLTILATAEETDGQFGLVHAQVRKGAGPPPHTHRNEDETFYILAGEGTFHVGDETIRAAPGMCIFLPRGIAHWFTIDSDAATFLNLITPGGFENYFKEVGEPVREGEIPRSPSGPPDSAKMRTVSANYGVTVVAGRS